MWRKVDYSWREEPTEIGDSPLQEWKYLLLIQEAVEMQHNVGILPPLHHL